MSNRWGFIAVLAVLLVCPAGLVSTGYSQFIISHTYMIHYVIDPKQVDYVVDVFKNQWHTQDPDSVIIGCNKVARITRDSAKDFGVGAACGVQRGNNRFSLLVCENSRFGGLVFAESQATAQEQVVRFIEGNCLPTDKR
jgi:hypothetical protein